MKPGLSADDEQEKETNCLDTTGVGYSWFKSNKFIYNAAKATASASDTAEVVGGGSKEEQ